MPLTASTGLVVQPSVAPGAPLPPTRASVTPAPLPGPLVTVLPLASWIATRGWVAHGPPGLPPEGCCTKPSLAGVARFTVKAALAAPPRPGLAAVRV